MHPVRTRRQTAQHVGRVGGIIGLGQDLAAEVDGGVGGDHECVGRSLHGERLGNRQAPHVGHRVFTVERGLVDVG